MQQWQNACMQQQQRQNASTSSGKMQPAATAKDIPCIA